ncbi:MAG TPA: radical SAM protein, partial [bacterium]|nr:radical SAM protein [bacterium]
VLPGEISNSREVLRFLKESISPDVFLSLMSQYHPAYKSGERKGLSRRLLPGEYIKVLEYCAELGLENGFRQTELV